MEDTSLLSLFAAHRALGSAPVHEHEWLVAHGQRRQLQLGEVIARKGERASSLIIVFSGQLVIRAGGPGSHKITDVRGGEVGGVLPFSRGAVPPNDVIAEEVTDVLEIAEKDLPELIRECPTVTATLVHVMIDRARQFKADERHEEKLVSLGRLAAGLAHELNNPAAAAARSAKQLADRVHEAQRAATAVGAASLSAAQLAAVDHFRSLCDAPLDASSRAVVLNADREDMICDWLTARGVDERCAAPLADSALTLDALDALAATVGADALKVCLRSVAAACEVRALTSEIESATARMSQLVSAMKGFTFMDRAHAIEPIDVRRSIDDTCQILAAKMRAKSAEICVRIASDLPPAHAVGADLNQVWLNLIDNALDAIPTGGDGRVMVTGDLEHGSIVVRVIDNGSGISRETMERIFDPFFTTKNPGEGTGLGLDITRRIVQQHDGEIDAESRPGFTQFSVRLPIAK